MTTKRKLWAKIELAILDNPKLEGLEPAGKWLYLASILLANADLTDGVVKPAVVCAEADIDLEFVEVLVHRGLWHRPGHDCPDCEQPPARSVVVHHYLQHQTPAAEVEARTEKRREAGRRGAAKRWQDPKPDSTLGRSAVPNTMANSYPDTDTDTEANLGQSVNSSRWGLSTTDLTNIAELTHGDLKHATKVITQILTRAGEVRNPMAYLLKTLEADPSRYRMTVRVTKATECPEHMGEHRDHCRACAIDAKLAPLPVEET